MDSELRYPKIMKPRGLRELNEYMIAKLGTPVFFAAPDLDRPGSDCPSGRLYEIVTGLYIIYKDYGMKLLQTYLEFCSDRLQECGGPAYAHYQTIKRLRGGLCHGCIPRGYHAAEFENVLLTLLSGGAGAYEDAPMSDEACGYMVNVLSDDADRFADLLKACADQISADPKLLEAWRKKLLKRALNRDNPQYGRNLYFDERIVKDLANLHNNGKNPGSRQLAIKKWLRGLEPTIRQGKIQDSEELWRSLETAIFELYHPVKQYSAPSSADILLGEFDF